MEWRAETQEAFGLRVNRITGGAGGGEGVESDIS